MTDGIGQNGQMAPYPNVEAETEMEQFREHCDELREWVEDATLILGPACSGLLKAVDAYEREPALLAELARLQREVQALRSDMAREKREPEQLGQEDVE